MEEWIISDSPNFESDLINKRLRFAYWEGHRDFAYDLIDFVKPKVIVELGSQYGCSLFAFCQSVKDNNLDTQINAIDFWSGDIGAEDTGEEVYKLVNYTISKFYSDIDIRLYPMEFDNALLKFGDESIDILHIDGGHKYEDVEHDLYMWLPKLKRNGIILFHDVYSHIDKGSCIHWAETKKKYKNYFEFKQSCGLGVLFPKDDDWYRKILAGGFSEKYIKIYYYRALYNYTQERFKELASLYEERYKAIEGQSAMINERDAVIKSQKELIDEKDRGMQEQGRMIDERDAVIKSQKELIDEKDRGMQEQGRMIDERDAAIKYDEQVISEHMHLLDEKEKIIEKVKKHKVMSKIIFRGEV